MSIIAWIILGLIAGWIASKIMHGSGSGFLLNLGLGIIGAFVGGFLFSIVGGAGVTGFNIWSLIVATIGAIVVLWVYNALSSRRAVR
ncbi:GlsB/YeaQ/YmgE family stress response membrane protein [Azospirillum halopraeferens]|uniref:GlsB/YeaQ/YmgE family stress response membrane protein n=1 Tax=Azospirillum halopraeferens TaxID=34010 RepID=UPI0003F541EF|nr:GlsB/YeaQ/YmgE family stress response membrane protein [Azospirillum halopraeferens]